MNMSRFSSRYAMTISRTTVGLLGLALCLAAPNIAPGAIALDVSFGSDTNGNPPVTGTRGSQPSGLGFADTAYVDHNNSTPGFFTLAAANGLTFTVTNSVVGMSNALVISNSGPVSATDPTLAYVDFSPLPQTTPANISRVSFDFCQIATPSGNNTGYRSDFHLQAFVGSSKAWLLGTSHVHPNDIILLQPAGVSQAIGTYTNGVATHVDVVTDHQAQKYSVYLNGALVTANESFYNAGAPVGAHFSELYLQQTSAEVGPNIIAFDNLQYESLPQGTKVLVH